MTRFGYLGAKFIPFVFQIAQLVFNLFAFGFANFEHLFGCVNEGFDLRFQNLNNKSKSLYEYSSTKLQSGTNYIFTCSVRID